jgi:hypothetical protein
MGKHQESAAKQATRDLIFDACKHLQRSPLTFLGMPAELALDILTLRSLLNNVICVAENNSTLEETRRSIAALPLKERRFIVSDIWEYLRTQYPTEPLLADVTFLDFYGGGLRKDDPFASEINGLRNYFAKQSRHQNRAFVLAWTYMPRDKGAEKYIDTLSRILPEEEIRMLSASKGVNLRSLAVRLLLLQHCREHDLRIKLFQHALYKNVMNTIIVIFSRGLDPHCTLPLADPKDLLQEPCCVYDTKSSVPRLLLLVDTE